MTQRAKSVLVTGGTRGIGRAIAEELSPTHDLLIGGRNEAAVLRVCAQLRSAVPFVADLADEEATSAAAGRIESLDAVVHSAGLLGHGRITELTRADWRMTMELNVIAVADLTRLLLPQLRSARGHVIVINSGSGYRSGAGGGLYSASKFAARAFTDALREEESASGVRVTSVHPGRVDTDMQRELVLAEGGTDYDGDRFIRPESIALTVRLALELPADAAMHEVSVRPGPR
ncbi:MAG: SDR family oxidoreductase [Actinomycetota bacterium]|nr:SDR family oxidoreductase [Actinomycetota bacterium]